MSLSLEQFNVWKSEEKHETQFYQFYQMHEQNAVLLPSTGFFLEQTYDILVIKKKKKTNMVKCVRLYLYVKYDILDIFNKLWS